MTAPTTLSALRRPLGVLLAPALLAACFRSLPPAELYRLRPTGVGAGAADGVSFVDDVARRPPAHDAPILTVEPYATPGVYAGPQIVYRVGETRYGTYPNREWALPLGGMLAALTTRTIAGLDGARARAQDGVGPGAPRGLVWRGVVREFEEVDRGQRVSAAVWLDARLVRAADDSVLWQGSARLERPVTPPDAMTAVVDRLADAAERAVARLVSEAEPAMRAAASASRVVARR